ncbi:hypothetical protein [Aliiroseovarius sp. PrR006]|uniref:NYN domain-containing protein n=1 Tax=Aliiroseovarius sp. PrR006 TaxID=2706883 RepID=UPI0013D1636E|nr:hypothetical protein [Aliiroseovarius sp. PrR006]NDW54771.1 hypothetical protein [Aliiroseovarius sp. PrR006]
MRILLLLLFYSLTVFSGLFTIAAFYFPDWSEYRIPLASVFVASLLLLIMLLKPNERRETPTKKRRGSLSQARIVVDGSNVMHWQNGEPSFAPLHDVVGELKRLGFMPGVIFDANAGYLLVGKYQDDDKLAKRLKLPENAVVVVAKGTPADQIILDAARNLNAIVVTNDRFRDWGEDYPEIHKRGFLIRGGYKSGKLWLDGKVKMAQKTQSRQ